MPIPTPGDILMADFLRPFGLSQNALARAIGVPPRRINEIVHGKRAITADTALRLARYFGTSERFWMNLQGRYDLETEKDNLGDRLSREVVILAKQRSLEKRRAALDELATEAQKLDMGY